MHAVLVIVAIVIGGFVLGAAGAMVSRALRRAAQTILTALTTPPPPTAADVDRALDGDDQPGTNTADLAVCEALLRHTEDLEQEGGTP